MYDSKIGRWMATDPYGQYPSPYLGMGNSPINGVDADGGLFDDILFDTETQTAKVYDTDGPDRTWVDGEYIGITGVDGEWKNYGYENVSFFNDHSLFYNELFGDNLLNDNFFNSLLGSTGKRNTANELFEARSRQSINTYGTQTALAVIAIGAAPIAAAEIAAVLPTTIAWSPSVAYADAGAGYNALNLVMQKGAYELVKYGTAGILLHPKTGRAGTKLFVELIYHSQRADYMKYFGTKAAEHIIKNGIGTE